MWYGSSMNFHPDDFLSLVEEAERQGGSHLNEVCEPTHFRLDLPVDEDNPQGPRVNRRLSTTGCHRHAKFLVALLPDEYFAHHDLTDSTIAEIERDGTTTHRMVEHDDFDFQDDDNRMAVMSDGTPALAKVCAVDDAMGLWPRFQDAMHTGESFQE